MVQRKQLAIGIGALGAGALALALLWPCGLSERPRPTICQSGARLSYTYVGFPWWVKARFEGGEELQVERSWSRLTVILPQSVEGKRSLLLEVGSLQPQSYRVAVTVDDTPPALRLLQPAADRSLPGEGCTLFGVAEPNSRIQIGDEGPAVIADSKGKFRLDIKLAAGWNDIKLSAVDSAGNRTQVERRLFSDREAPRFTVERLGPDGESAPLRGKDSPRDTFRIRLAARDDGGLDSARFRLDEGKWGRLPLTNKDGAWVASFPLRDLPEGLRSLQLEVVDRAGRRTAEEFEFVVDSTEELGKKMLTRGARGNDVRQMQERLVEAGSLTAEQVTGEFDEVTEQAVVAFQKAEGLPATGRVAQLTLAALGPRILVHLARRELVLDRPGQPPRRYSVAVGAPEFPTPTGRFVIYEKVADPSWIPPDSPWAKEAKTIPPGPDNPLGTRWIGLDWGNVGIHGTNADWTIGSASSHGCIRMHLSDVEELYELVRTTMPVTVYGGWESDPVMKRFWPG